MTFFAATVDNYYDLRLHCCHTCLFHHRFWMGGCRCPSWFHNWSLLCQQGISGSGGRFVRQTDRQIAVMPLALSAIILWWSLLLSKLWCGMHATTPLSLPSLVVAAAPACSTIILPTSTILCSCWLLNFIVAALLSGRLCWVDNISIIIVLLSSSLLYVNHEFGVIVW